LTLDSATGEGAADDERAAATLALEGAAEEAEAWTETYSDSEALSAEAVAEGRLPAREEET
jgi:hypothetical protein